MADVTISSLPLGTPSGNLILPISDGNNTFKAPLSDIQVNYNSVVNKPTIPAAQVNSDWNASSGVSQILNKPNTGLGGMQLFTSSGTFTVPTGVTKIKVIAISGGNSRGTTGGSSTVSGTGITAVASGTGSGTIVGASNAGTTGIGGEGFRFYGMSNIYGYGGNTSSGTAASSGGTAIGIASVTSGQNLTVTVGAGGPGGTSGLQTYYAGGPGAVLIEW